jgi:hypothetical protein
MSATRVLSGAESVHIIIITTKTLFRECQRISSQGGIANQRGSLNLNLATHLLKDLLISHRVQAEGKQRHSIRTRLEENSRVVQDESEYLGS